MVITHKLAQVILFLFNRERERERGREGGRERERETTGAKARKGIISCSG
jgi:hypothetical protein